MNELDEMLLSIDQEEALMSALDAHRPKLFAFFEDPLRALLDGGVDRDDHTLAMAYDQLRSGLVIAEQDFLFRYALLLGAWRERGDKLDYHAAARMAARSMDERLEMLVPTATG